MKAIIFVSLIFLAVSTWAKTSSHSSSSSSSYSTSPYSSSYSDSSYSSYSNYSYEPDKIWADAGFANGSLVVGGAYEHPMYDSMGLGGRLDIFQRELEAERGSENGP